MASSASPCPSLCYYLPSGADRSMFSLAIWIAGLVLEATVVLRGLRGRFVSKYPLFYIYLAFVLLTSFSLLLIYWMRSNVYGRVYWYIEFGGVALGCGVVWELYRGALHRFPGAARMARNALLLVLAVVCSKAIVNNWNGVPWWPKETMVQLERDLRAVQAAAMVGLIAVISLYRIPLGRNLWGMTLGYGLLLSSNVVTLSLRAFLGSNFQNAWRYLQPVSYLTVLMIWCVALWSYTSAPLPATHANVEWNYGRLAEATKKGLRQARTHLGKATRS